MRVNVITVSFNSSKTIADTCISVKLQVGCHIEHLVIDGGSTDGTQDIAAKAIRSGGRIFSEPDRGIYDAMNKGLRHSTCDIVGFLNSDDLFHDQNVIARISEVFSDPAVDAVFGDLVYVSRFDPTRIVRYWDSSTFNSSAFSYGVMPPHPTLYVRGNVLRRFGGFRLDLPMANDFEFCARYIASHRVRYRHMPHTLVKMRLGGESNRSLRNIALQNFCIFRALRLNGIIPHPLYPLAKALDKGRQFIRRPPATAQIS